MEWLNKLTSSQYWAASRHYITFGAGILATLGFITATQQQDLIKSFGDFVSGATQMLAAVATLAGLAAGAINSWKAAHRASPTEQVKSVAEMAKDPESPIKGVITENNAAGVALAKSIPGPEVVPAGTVQAAQIASAPMTMGKTA